MGTTRTAERQRGDFSLPVLFYPREILLRIALKRLVDCECAPQRAGLGVYERVVLEIFGRNGGGVERELVVEMLQVDTLSACDECLGQVGDGVEDAVKLSLHGRHGLRIGVGLGAGKRAFAPDNARDEFGVPGRVGVGDHATNVVTRRCGWVG